VQVLAPYTRVIKDDQPARHDAPPQPTPEAALAAAAKTPPVRKAVRVRKADDSAA
jgi:hypothetical protein